MRKILDDPSAEFSHYRLRLAFLSVALLHENPLSNIEHGQTQECSIKEMSVQYFQKVYTIATAARSDMKALRKSFSDVLKYDHLRYTDFILQGYQRLTGYVNHSLKTIFLHSAPWRMHGNLTSAYQLFLGIFGNNHLYCYFLHTSVHICKLLIKHNLDK